LDIIGEAGGDAFPAGQRLLERRGSYHHAIAQGFGQAGGPYDMPMLSGRFPPAERRSNWVTAADSKDISPVRNIEIRRGRSGSGSPWARPHGPGTNEGPKSRAGRRSLFGLIGDHSTGVCADPATDVIRRDDHRSTGGRSATSAGPCRSRRCYRDPTTQKLYEISRRRTTAGSTSSRSRR